MGEARRHYADDLTVKEARRLYFEENGFGDGGYGDTWVKLQAGPLPIYFPNTRPRVEAVRRHDIHHVLTGYETTWTGESEIGGWEIGSGCGRYVAAWALNLQALLIGLVIAPAAVLRAFAWGRRTQNLYHASEDPEDLVDEPLGELRRRLGLDRPPPAPGALDAILLGLWMLVAVPVFLLSLAVPLAPLALLAWLVLG